jgi:hypothetical protein
MVMGTAVLPFVSNVKMLMLLVEKGHLQAAMDILPTVERTLTNFTDIVDAVLKPEEEKQVEEKKVEVVETK